MTLAQKLGRIFLFTTTLVIISVLSSTLAAAAIFAFQHSLKTSGGYAELAGDVGIIYFSMMVNAVCVIVLLGIRKADHKLIPPAASTSQAEPPAHRSVDE